MKLWSDEIEAMRPEARDAVAKGMEAMQAMIGDRSLIDPTLDKFERAKRQREMFAVSFAPVPEAEDREIAGVRCRVFVPDRAATAVYLHFHGGGMILGAPEMNDASNLELSRRTGMAVVSVDYRMAPEHPFPAGPDDGVAVAAWLLEHGESEFGSPRILTGGESAGGYMAAAVLLRIRDELGAVDRVDGANLVYGVHDWGRPPSLVEPIAATIEIPRGGAAPVVYPLDDRGRRERGVTAAAGGNGGAEFKIPSQHATIWYEIVWP